MPIQISIFPPWRYNPSWVCIL